MSSYNFKTKAPGVTKRNGIAGSQGWSSQKRPCQLCRAEDTKVGRNIPVTGAQVQQASLVLTVLCRPRLMVGDAAMELLSQRPKEMMEF